MNDFVNNHLQQRKNSLNLNKNSSRPSLKTSETKPSSNQYKDTSSSQSTQSKLTYNPHHSSTHKIPSKNHKELNPTFSIDSLPKNIPKPTDQQNTDYIRNLYKKYLGKQNKQSSEKLNAYTERKLRTTQSRQILINNTGAKDFTKRALFKDVSDSQLVLYPNDKKMLKSRDLTFAYQEAQAQQVSNGQFPSQTRCSLKTKKPSVKKNDKQTANEKQKSQAKKYKSKQKVEKGKNEKDHKGENFQKVQSKISKGSQSRSSQNQVQKRKVLTEMGVSGRQQQKVKIKQKVAEGSVHPHRESYCQFDTQQQNQSTIKVGLARNDSNEIRISKGASTIRNENDLVSSQIIDYSVQKEKRPTYEGLQIFLGQQNSLIRALKRINKVKEMNERRKESDWRKSESSSRNQRGLSCSKERRTLIY